MFISVDLPAPFSPTSAWNSPEWRSNVTRSSARTPGNRLEMPRISRRGAGMSVAVDVVVREVSVLDDRGVDVALVDDDRRDEDRRYILLAVVDLVRRVDRFFLRQLDRGFDRS